MKVIHLRFGALWVGLVYCGAAIIQAEAETKTSTYQIKSGTYRVDGGLVGSILYSLPNEEQAFISLTLNSNSGSAKMEFLPRNGSSPFLVLSNGVVTGDEIRFQYTKTTTSGVPAPATVSTDYTVVNHANSLSLSGSNMLVYANPCNDCPYAFIHSDVQASLIPSLSIRVSEVELYWSTVSNQTYQVQYNSDFTTNLWTNLGAPVVGDGAVHCIQDTVVPAETRRLYRLVLSQ